MDMAKIREIATAGYVAYGDSAGWTNVAGNPMPAWADLGPEVQSHWVNAVAAIGARYGNELLTEARIREQESNQ